MIRGYRKALERNVATSFGGHADTQSLALAGADIHGTERVARSCKLDLIPRNIGFVADRDPKLCALAREHGLRTGELNVRPQQVVVAVVHRNERERPEQERENEAEARAVVQRAEQHREHERAEDRAETASARCRSAGVAT